MNHYLDHVRDDFGDLRNDVLYIAPNGDKLCSSCVTTNKGEHYTHIRQAIVLKSPKISECDLCDNVMYFRTEEQTATKKKSPRILLTIE